jgi:PAS domain S-box-containing protein
MKSKITPTRQQVCFNNDELIISKTDLSGRLTYVNRLFMQVCNYPEKTLLGAQHNIVRHPDMPRGVFLLMWNTLKAGREFFGLVKNMTADGHFYWVFANVTIDRRDGQPVGYFSVRRQAPQAAIDAAAALYQKMNEIEQASGPARAAEASLQWLQDHLQQQGASYEHYVLTLYTRAMSQQGASA